MKKSEFKSALQSEISNSGLLGKYKITNVSEEGVNTVIYFNGEVTKELQYFLNNRFTNGVRVPFKSNAVYLNTPNEGAKIREAGKREPGFYWVEEYLDSVQRSVYGSDTRMIVAEWDGTWWWIGGSDEMWKDVNFKSINENKIQQP